MLTYLLYYGTQGRTDKNLCRCFGAPARRVFPDHLITCSLPFLRPVSPLSKFSNAERTVESHENSCHNAGSERQTAQDRHRVQP